MEEEIIPDIDSEIEEEVFDTEIIAEERVIETGLVVPPYLPIPRLYPFKLKRQTSLHPIPIPTRGRQTTTVITVPFKIKLKEFIEGPLLTSIGIFSLILALLYFGETGETGQETSEFVKSITYTIAGIIIITVGYLMIEDKFPLIKGSQYYLGTLLVIIGFLLGISQNINTIIAENQIPIFFILLLMIITGGIGYKNDSIMTLSLVTIVGMIIPQILATSGNFDWSILLFGGGLFWLIPIAIFTIITGLKEKSFVPAILMLALGPSVGISIINFWNQPESVRIAKNDLFPALGIVISVLPVAILLMKGRVEMISVYMRSLYGLIFAWPLVAFFAQFYNPDDVKFGIFNPLILFVGLSMIYHISTTIRYGDYEGSELIRTTSLEMDKFTRYIVPIIGFVAVTNALFSGDINVDSGLTLDDRSEFVLNIVLPASLFIIITGAYALLTNLKLLSFGSEKSAIFTIILVEYTLISMSFKVGESVLFEDIASLFIIVVLLNTLGGGILVHIFRKYFSKSDNVLLVTCVITLTNSFIFLLSEDVLLGNWAIIASFIGFGIFGISILLPKLEDYERIRLNQVALFGNFSLLSLVQLYSDKYESKEVNSFFILDVDQKYLISPLVVFSVYVFMAILTGLVLHKFIIKRKISSDEIPGIFGLSSEHSSGLVRFSIAFEQKLLEFQEISLSAFINVLFIIFALTDGFGRGDEVSSGLNEENLSIIVLMALTPIFLAINFITRSGSWLTLIPSLITLYIASIQLQIQSPINFEQLMLVLHSILASYVVLSIIISRLDQVRDHPHHFNRANARNISLWITQLLILESAGTNNYWETVLISVLLLQFTSVIIDLTRGEFFATGFTLLISSIFLSRITTESDIAVILSLFSIGLASLMFIYQYLRTDVLKKDKIKIPEGVKGVLGELDIDSSKFTSDTIITLRNLMPALITIFILFPSGKDLINSELPISIDSHLIFISWFFILSLITIALAEFSGHKSKNALFTILIYIIPLFINNASNEISEIESTIGISGLVLLNSYFIFQSIKLSNEGQRDHDVILGVIVSLTSIPAYVYFEKLINIHNLILPIFLFSTSLILFYQLHFISEDKFAAIPTTLFFAMMAFLPLDEFVYSNFSLSLLPYIGLIFVNIHQAVISKDGHQYTEIFTSASFAIQFIFNFELFNIAYYDSSEFFEAATTVLLALILGSIIIFEWKNSDMISETSSGLLIILAAGIYNTDYLYRNVYVEGLTWDGFATPTTLFPLLYLYQLFKIYLQERRETEYGAISALPVVITALVYFLAIKFESQFTFAFVMSIGLMTILLEYLDRNRSKGLISMSYIWAIVFIWIEGQEVTELDSNPYFISSLLLLPLILLIIVKSDAELFDRWLLYIGSSVTFTGVLLIKQIIGIGDPLNLVYLSLIGLFSMSYIVWAAKEERFSLLNIYNFAAIAVVLSNTNTNENSLFPVIVFAGNIVYMFFNLFSKSEKIPRSRSFSFGIVILFLGTWFGSNDTIWDILSPTENDVDVLNQFWMALYLIWLAASILEILSAGIEFRYQNFYIKLHGYTDAFAFAWFGFFAIETFWRGMLIAESVLWIMVGTAFISLLITILSSNMRLNEDPNFSFLIGSYVIFTLFSGFFLSNNSFLDDTRRPKSTNFDILGDSVRYVDVMNLMVLTPLAISIFIMTYRSVNSLGDINSDGLLLGLASTVIIPFAVYFDRFGNDNFATIFVPGIVFTWTTLLIGARKQNYQITTITSMMLYIQVIMISIVLDPVYAKGGLSAWVVASMITTLLVFLYIVRAEMNKNINESHHSVLLVTIAVQIFSILAMHLESGDLDVVITVVTASLAILGAIIYVYGTKFIRPRYTNIGMGITWMNLLKTGYHFLDPIFTDRQRGEGGELLLFISFLTVSIMIFVIRGFGTISKQENLKGVLKFLFEPVQRDNQP